MLYCSIFELYSVQIVNIMKDEENLEILRKIYKNPDSSQREIAGKLGFSLGKLNYCLKALQKKAWLKLKIFKKVKIKLTT